jgi:hypothetical protein
MEAITAYRAANIAINRAENLAGFDALRRANKATGDPAVVGGRNSAAASLAGQLFAKGQSAEEVRTELRKWNATNDVPLPDSELMGVVDSIH